MTIKKLSIRVPATTANLGPGFDCLGLALNLYNMFTFAGDLGELKSAGELRALSGAYKNKSAVFNPYVRYAEAYGVRLPVPEIGIAGDVPIARGLGSSATCSVAGAAAAQELARLSGQVHDAEATRERLLAVATEAEGHPDNAAPAIYGGLMLSAAGEPDEKGLVRVDALRLPLSPELRFLCCVPGFRLSTEKARSVLPREVPMKDAVANLSALAFLMNGLATGSEEALSRGSNDRLHQPYRAGLIRGWDEVLSALRANGAAGAVLSGAGPTILGFVNTSRVSAGEAAKSVRTAVPPGWDVYPLEPDMSGVLVRLS